MVPRCLSKGAFLQCVSLLVPVKLCTPTNDVFVASASAKLKPLAAKLGLLECTQRAGETMFVPWGWWHVVINETFTTAVTQNYLSAAHFPAVWSRFYAAGTDGAEGAMSWWRALPRRLADCVRAACVLALVKAVSGMRVSQAETLLAEAKEDTDAGSAAASAVEAKAGAATPAAAGEVASGT
jgi:hypothetical protein